MGGILFLLLAMGISRFAFTPILPFMRENIGFSFETAGYLASSNYIGYFIGALWAGMIYKHKQTMLYWHVMSNIISVIMMGFTESFFLWVLLRLISGISSGIIFVLASSMVLDYLTSHSLAKWSGYLFSGIGFGIAISGLLVPFLHTYFSWEGTWIGLGLLSLFLAFIAFSLWRNLTLNAQQKEGIATQKQKIRKSFMPWLIAAYGLEGLGYIVTATFLVDIIHNIPSLQPYSTYTWVLVGLAVIPSAVLWMSIMNKLSPTTTLCTALLLQAIGILLPIFSQTIWSVSISALLFGLTFIGIVTISTSYARQLMPGNSTKVVSYLTTVYAIGQIIGPIVAGKLSTHFQSYKTALLFAGIVILLSISLLLIGKWKSYMHYSSHKTA